MAPLKIKNTATLLTLALSLSSAVGFTFTATSASAMAKHAPGQTHPTDPMPEGVANPAPTSAPAVKSAASPLPSPTRSPSPSPSPSAVVTDPRGAELLNELRAGDSTKTPYQLLADLFEVGKPTAISEFPSFEDCVQNPKTFRAMNTLSEEVTPSTKKEDLSFSESKIVLNLTRVEVKAGSGQAAVSQGPLFPISPAIPAVDTVIPNLLLNAEPYYRSEGCQMSSEISSDLKKQIIENHYSFSDTPEGATEIEYAEFGHAESVYHSVAGVIVCKMNVTKKDEHGVETKTVSYTYMWDAQ